MVEPPGVEPTLEAVVPAGQEAIQHVGSWLLLGLLERLEFSISPGDARRRADGVAAPGNRRGSDLAGTG